MSDHVHQWGEVEHAQMTGNPHRRCVDPDCSAVTLDLTDGDDDEEPTTGPAPGAQPFDAFEIHACLPLRVLDPSYAGAPDDREAMEQVDDPAVLEEYAEHVVWSVYGHRTWPDPDGLPDWFRTTSAYRATAWVHGMPVTRDMHDRYVAWRRADDEAKSSGEYGLTCVGDFSTHQYALEMATALAATAAGVPVHDETPA